jgi:RNA polymerase sigma-70 factor (ECF subfamily)
VSAEDEGGDRSSATRSGLDDDAALVAAAQGGDRDALDRLLRLHHDRIYAVCRRLTGSPTDAADAAQEALIAIVRGLPRFDGRARFATWAYRVTTNACLDELRRRRRRPALAAEAVDEWNGSAGEPYTADRQAALADRMAIDAALARLPEEFRVPVVLRDLADLDYGEIADALSIPVGTVKSRIARGRSQLARLLGPDSNGNQQPSPERPTP